MPILTACSQAGLSAPFWMVLGNRKTHPCLALPALFFVGVQGLGCAPATGPTSISGAGLHKLLQLIVLHGRASGETTARPYARARFWGVSGARAYLDANGIGDASKIFDVGLSAVCAACHQLQPIQYSSWQHVKARASEAMTLSKRSSQLVKGQNQHTSLGAPTQSSCLVRSPIHTWLQTSLPADTAKQLSRPTHAPKIVQRN